MALRIEDYALIGDCQTAGLVGADGSIDWMCFPRFDSPACFAALLGDEKNGRWLISPAQDVRSVRRRYLGDSLILETEFSTDSGTVSLVDFMPPRSNEADVVRLVIGRAGEVPMHMQLVIRFDYGSYMPWVRHVEGGLHAMAGPDAVLLQSPIPTRGENFTTVADFTVKAGQRVPFTLMWYRSFDDAPVPEDPEAMLQFTQQWWRDWSSRCSHAGPWRDPVMRSLITLKALTYAPTGGIVAAATTSLPEQLGGPRNWDYRYCWLRDATFTLYALVLAGYDGEAKAWRDWLLRAVAGAPSQLHIMYSVLGERRLEEIELKWLSGYEGSKPVRIGNAASEQFQLDVYGEVVGLLYQCERQGFHGDENEWHMECALLDFLESAWRMPDEGIWEVRGPRRHFTHSKIMAWVAFDCGIKTMERFGREGPIDRWRKIRAEIHREVCTKGFNPALNAFVQYYGSDLLDASLLVTPLVGFLPAEDPRVRGTVQAIEKHLVEDGFVMRYATESGVDGLPPGEGAFLPCSFWLIDNLLLQGRYDQAQRDFERLLSIRSDLGLLSEQYDTRAKRLVGNYPQAFSHVALINTARNLTGPGGPAEQRPAS